MGSFWESMYVCQAQGRRNLNTHHHLDSLGQLSIQGRSIWEEILDLYTCDFWCCNLCQASLLVVFWKALVSSVGQFSLLLLPLPCIWPCFYLFQGMTECLYSGWQTLVVRFTTFLCSSWYTRALLLFVLFPSLAGRMWSFIYNNLAFSIRACPQDYC